MNKKKYTFLSYFIFKAQFIGLSSITILTVLKQDAWLGIILAFIIGFIPVLLIKALASSNEENIIDFLNKKNKTYINYLIGIFLLFIIFINFWNITNLIYTQYLNKTPIFIISIFLIIPIISLINKNYIIIIRVGFILFTLSILLSIFSILGLVNKINFANLLPLLETNPTKGIIPYISYNVLSIFTILLFPGKYVKKSIVKGYIFSFISIILTITCLISVLGINLTLLFQYPEFNLLKLSYTGIINFRLENILAIQWLIDIYFFISICFKYCNTALNIKKNYILPVVIVLINSIITFDSASLRHLIIYKLPYIYLIIFSILIIIIYIIKKSSKTT